MIAPTNLIKPPAAVEENESKHLVFILEENKDVKRCDNNTRYLKERFSK